MTAGVTADVYTTMVLSSGAFFAFFLFAKRKKVARRGDHPAPNNK